MNELKDAMDSLCPTDEQRERMFLKAEIMAEKSSPKKRRGKIKMIVIAVAAMTALVGTTTAFASDIRQFFHGFFSDDTLISEDIIENIYEDSTDHLKFTVERIVSDRISTYAIVKYTALDDRGRQWLGEDFLPYDVWNQSWEEKLSDYHDIFERLNIKPDAPMSYMLGLNSRELTQPEDVDCRTFRIGSHSMDEIIGSNCIQVVYQMSDGLIRKARLDVSESVPLIEAKLDGEKSEDMPYIPIGIKYSQLGITIYGKKIGDVKDINSFEEKGKIRIIMKDGSEIMYKSSGSCEIDDPNCDYDYIIFSTHFEDPVNVEDISGIWIHDSLYEIK